MAWYFVVFLFIFSCFLLSWLSSKLIKSLVQIAKYLGWREFIIAFFIMAFATSLPDLLVSVNAVLQNKPLLALGDILGGNLVDFTLVLAIAVFFTKKGLSAESDMVQSSAIFTTVIAILPLLLIFDGRLDRIDGIISILAFLLYSWWLFSKSERFKKRYRHSQEDAVVSFKAFLGNLLKFIFLLILLLLASQAVIMSAQFFSDKLGVSIGLIGILIVGLGNTFPDIYFSIISAKKDENWLILGDIMGSVIICATLVLGIIGLIAPFTIDDFSPFLTARIFLILAALISLLFIRTNKKISKREGLYLLFIYVLFLIIEVFVQ